MKITKKNIDELINSIPKKKQSEPFSFVGILDTPFGMLACRDGKKIEGNKKAKDWLKEILNKKP